eukprot:XP_001699556.1 predicted protein [Chlamydomonas reinhardtii]
MIIRVCGLYTGYYAAQAALRYEKHWCKLLAAPNGRRTAIPPLDVAYAWLVHRQHPSAYKDDTAARGVVRRHPLTTQVSAMPRMSWQLHTWLRPHFLDPAFLGRAARRRLPRSAASALAPVTAGSDKSAAATDVKFEHLSSRLTATAAVAAAPPLPPSTQWPAAASSPAASLLFDPDYLALSPDKRAEAYGRTAALYQQMYGEPYNDPDTAWIAPDVPYPLAAPCSPIAPLLRAFDDNPQHAAQTGAVAAAKRLGCFNSSTCGGRCMVSSSRTRNYTISHAVAAVVSCAYFLDLPVSLQERQPSATTATAGGYSPADPWLLLAPAQRYPLDGLQLLLEASARLDPELVNPLWAILLTRPGMAAEMQSVFYAAWAEAAARGVDCMHFAYQRQSVRPAADGIAYYGPTDYYNTVALLYYDGGGTDTLALHIYAALASRRD